MDGCWFRNMNFLAHFYLSGEDEHLITGNFLGDFLSNRAVADLPEPVRAGVRLHRKIDSFTDQHPVIRQSVKWLRPAHGKYAPVLLDVFHDFILAKNWERYSSEGLGDFTKNVYAVLMKYIHLMPEYLRERLPRMVADDWLVRYGTPEGLEFTFSRMKMRSSRPEFFDHALLSLKQHYDALEAEFNLFFPDLISFVKNDCLIV